VTPAELVAQINALREQVARISDEEAELLSQLRGLTVQVEVWDGTFLQLSAPFDSQGQ